jgi:hypothetical protein
LYLEIQESYCTLFVYRAIKESGEKRILLPWTIIGECPLILTGVGDEPSCKIKVPVFLLGEKEEEGQELGLKEVSMDGFREIGVK